MQWRCQPTLSKDVQRAYGLVADLRGVIEKERDYTCIACNCGHGAGRAINDHATKVQRATDKNSGG